VRQLSDHLPDCGHDRTFPTYVPLSDHFPGFLRQEKGKCERLSPTPTHLCICTVAPNWNSGGNSFVNNVPIVHTVNLGMHNQGKEQGGFHRDCDGSLDGDTESASCTNRLWFPAAKVFKGMENHFAARVIPVAMQL
jgi:hypothetical protein